ncbi:MAG: hypothetical protein Ct9H300mP11_28670 [Chloroflexota bacterium]|nr:MAG: hypothetical protein Ct9H300mP11_28670 [Chloroflexota bacterium]
MEQNQKVPAPAGMAMFPQEISKPPKEWGGVPMSSTLDGDDQRGPLCCLGRAKTISRRC